MFLPMDWKSTALISGAGLLATWVFSMPDAVTPAATTTASTPQSSRVAASTIDIQREAARLQVRLHSESRVTVTSRNPFQFGSRAPRDVARREPATETAVSQPVAAATPIPQPQFSLDGIVTDMVDGQEQRTAVLHTDSGMVLAKEGDLVSGQYRVMTVAPDAAELMNVSTSSVVRLGLR